MAPSDPPFQYFPLLQDDQIRLVTIHPGKSSQQITSTMSLASLSASFEALSYTWGDPNATCVVRCNECSLRITKSLRTALQHLRRRDAPVTLWIDQICINQQDLDEKRHQIGLMSRIFSSARRVVVWLGPQAEGSKTALKFARSLIDMLLPTGLPNDAHLLGGTGELIRSDHFYPYEGRSLPKRQHKKWRALRAFLSRPWFTRIWVIQEAAVASDIIVLCGKQSIPWKELLLLVQILYSHIPPLFFGADTEIQGLPGDHVRDICRIQAAKDEDITPDFYELICRHRGYQATDPRDKLYALVGLAGLDMATDYRMPVPELYTRTMLHFLAQYLHTDDLPSNEPVARVLLSKTNISVGLPVSRRGRLTSPIYAAGTASQQLALPSWVPDWSCSTVLFPIFGYVPSQRQRRVIEAGGSTLGFIELSGLSYEIKDNIVTVPSIPDTLQLHIEGKLCDTVKSASATLIRHDAPLESPAQQKALTAWFLESGRILFDARGNNASYTFYCVLSMSWASELLLDHQETHHSKKIYDALPYLKFKRSAEFKAKMPFEVSNSAMFEGLPRIIGRSFFLTERGEPGLAPHGTRPGDMLALFLGFDIPVILRPVGNGTFRLVGQCYVLSDHIWNGGAIGVRDSENPYHNLPLEMITLV